MERFNIDATNLNDYRDSKIATFGYVIQNVHPGSEIVACDKGFWKFDMEFCRSAGRIYAIETKVLPTMDNNPHAGVFSMEEFLAEQNRGYLKFRYEGNQSRTELIHQAF